MNYTGSQVPAQVSRERSQGGFPPPSPLLMENLRPGPTTGSVISVGMLNQHLAIGTEGMELGGLWDRRWPPRRDTGGTGVTQQCLTVEGAIPMAGKPGGKLASPASHPSLLLQDQLQPRIPQASLWECPRMDRTPRSCSPKDENPSGPPFTAWMLHPRMLKPWDARASAQLCLGSPLAFTAAINFPGSGMAGPAPRQIQPLLRG